MKNFKTVWCENAKGFEHCGNCFLAKVLDDAVMDRPARKGYVWVQQLETPKHQLLVMHGLQNGL